MPATYEPIATTTLGSAAASISFTSIATSWTDLRVVVNGTPTANLQFLLRFNNDSATNYSGTDLDGNGTSAASNRYTGDTGIYANWSAFATSAQPAFITYDVFSYAGSTFKTALTTFNQDRNGTGFVERGVGLWRSTSAINRVDIVASANSFNTGTTATLYGIKAA